MAATDQLLPAATAVQAGTTTGCGQALTFYFQYLSPKLPKAEEVSLLLSVLDHREAMLRRYGISLRALSHSSARPGQSPGACVAFGRRPKPWPPVL